MSDFEKPKSWKERKLKIKRKWLVLFIFTEWLCEWVSYLLGQWSFLDILGHAGRLTILVAVIFYFAESGDRRKAKQYQAWQVINAAQGKPASGGRIEALQNLNRDEISLSGIDMSGAYLPGLNLKNAIIQRANFEGAWLRGANFIGANIAHANLSHADLEMAYLVGAWLHDTNLAGAWLRGANLIGADFPHANLAGANLTHANLKDIENWQEIESIELANIYGVKNPPDGFIKWAKEQGAVSIEDYQEWIKLLQEKWQEKTKKEQ